MTQEQAAILRKLAAGGMAKATLENNRFCDTEKAREKGRISGVAIDMKEPDCISSAGLRVLLMRR